MPRPKLARSSRFMTKKNASGLARVISITSSTCSFFVKRGVGRSEAVSSTPSVSRSSRSPDIPLETTMNDQLPAHLITINRASPRRRRYFSRFRGGGEGSHRHRRGSESAGTSLAAEAWTRPMTPSSTTLIPRRQNINELDVVSNTDSRLRTAHTDSMIGPDQITKLENIS